MVCNDIAKIIMGYVRDFQRFEKIEMIYQRYKTNFEYVYCPAVPKDEVESSDHELSLYARKFSRAQRLVYLWALKVARMGCDWRYWTERLVAETDFKQWEDEFFYTGYMGKSYFWIGPFFFARKRSLGTKSSAGAGIVLTFLNLPFAVLR